jgi:hypothetical protein
MDAPIERGSTLSDQPVGNGWRERAFRVGRHAKNRLRQKRGTPEEVTVDELFDIIEHPELVTPSIKGRLNAWRRREPKWIRVTYIERGTTIDIITVTVRSKEPGSDADEIEADL